MDFLDLFGGGSHLATTFHGLQNRWVKISYDNDLMILIIIIGIVIQQIMIIIMMMKLCANHR